MKEESTFPPPPSPSGYLNVIIYRAHSSSTLVPDLSQMDTLLALTFPIHSLIYKFVSTIKEPGFSS